MRKQLTTKQRAKMQTRLDDIYENALCRYLDKTDFNAYEWMDEDDRQEYLKLELNLGLMDAEDYKDMSGKD